MAHDTHAHDVELEEPPVPTPLSDLLGFLSRLSSIALIIGVLLLPYSYVVDPTGAGLRMILSYSNFLWAIYIVIQVLESAQRDFTATWSWIFDNVLAVTVLILGFLILGNVWGPRLTFDQAHLLLEALVWDGVDLVTGLLIPIVIAGSIKFRKEE